MSDNEDFIDIRKSIQSKNPTLLKFLPKFILNYIRRTIHEDEMNDVIRRYKGINGLDFVHKMVHDEFKINISVKGFEDISPNKRYIFVANHPWGGLEAAALLDIVGKKFPEPRFIVNDILMSLKNYQPLFLPVNKYGAQARENVKILDENFASDKPILIFPAGLVSRKIKGKVIDLEWKKNFITKAIQHKREVVPVFIDGRNSEFFYRVANIRKMLGIRANIEMFYLADELMKNTGADLPFYFGKAIPYQKFDKSKKPEEWAQAVKDFTYSLKEDYKQDFS
jgi:1-acyl-sn-glycerol-3-phosphate acyltransferase